MARRFYFLIEYELKCYQVCQTIKQLWLSGWGVEGILLESMQCRSAGESSLRSVVSCTRLV